MDHKVAQSAEELDPLKELIKASRLFEVQDCLQADEPLV